MSIQEMGDEELISAYERAALVTWSRGWSVTNRTELADLRAELLRRLSAGNPQGEKVQITSNIEFDNGWRDHLYKERNASREHVCGCHGWKDVTTCCSLCDVYPKAEHEKVQITTSPYLQELADYVNAKAERSDGRTRDGEVAGRWVLRPDMYDVAKTVVRDAVQRGDARRVGQCAPHDCERLAGGVCHNEAHWKSKGLCATCYNRGCRSGV